MEEKGTLTAPEAQKHIPRALSREPRGPASSLSQMDVRAAGGATAWALSPSAAPAVAMLAVTSS